MRKRLMLLALLLASCAAPPPAAKIEQLTPITPVSTPTDGAEVLRVYTECSSHAAALCPAAGTIRCEAYRSAFVKGCLVNAGVPGDMVFALMH